MIFHCARFRILQTAIYQKAMSKLTLVFLTIKKQKLCLKNFKKLLRILNGLLEQQKRIKHDY